MAWEDELFALLDDLERQAEALYDAERGPSWPTAAGRSTSRSPSPAG